MLLRCLLVAVCFAALSCAALPAAAASIPGCSFDGLDFSPMAGTDITGSDSDGSTQYTYYLSMCGPLSSAASSVCVQQMGTAAACQLQAMPPATYINGAWDKTATPTFSYTEDKTGVTFNMPGSDQCWQPGGTQLYHASVILQCAKVQGPLVITSSAATPCTKIWTLPTPHACAGSGGGGSSGGSKKGGLSGGWIFVIILLVLIPLYVLGGCIYKSQKLGATGMDKCPNVEFWRDLPSLVKEGFGFVFGKLRGLCGGRAAASSSSYETM